MKKFILTVLVIGAFINIGTFNALAVEPNSLNDGLVVRYEFENAANILKDSSGRGNDATVLSGKLEPQLEMVEAKVGNGAALFDYYRAIVVDLLGDMTFKPNTDKDGLTFSFWVFKKHYFTDKHQLVLNVQGLNLYNGETTFHLCLDSRPNENRTGYLTFEKPGLFFGQRTTTNLQSPGSWNHVVLVKNRIFWEIYINGIKLDQAYISGDFYPAKFVIGHGNSNGSFTGYVDDFRLYNRALSLYEIQKLYQNMYVD